MAFHAEVDSSCFPFLALLFEERADQAQQGGLIGEESRDSSPAFELHVDPFEGIGGSEAALMGLWEVKDGEAHGEILLHPGCKFGMGGGVAGDERLESGLGSGQIRAVEDGADVMGDSGALVQAGDVGLGVLLEMELAALPGHGWEDRPAGRAEACVVIADDQLDSAESLFMEGTQEGSPMDLGLAEGGADTEDGALSVHPDAGGDEDSAVDDLAVLADLLVAGIEQDIGELGQRSVAPGLEFGVESCGAEADLSGADGGATELLDDGGDFAGGHALDVHLGQGEFEGLFAADALSRALG